MTETGIGIQGLEAHCPVCNKTVAAQPQLSRSEVVAHSSVETTLE